MNKEELIAFLEEAATEYDEKAAEYLQQAALAGSAAYYVGCASGIRSAIAKIEGLF